MRISLLGIFFILTLTLLFGGSVFGKTFEEVQKFLEECNYKRAYKLLQRFLQENQEHLEAQKLYIRLSFLTGEYSDLEKQLKIWCERSPSSRGYQADLAEVLYLQGKYEEAVILLEKLLQAHPEYLRPFYFRALIYREKGQNDEAKKALRKFVDLWNANTQSIQEAESLYYISLALWDYCFITDTIDRFQVSSELANKILPKVTRLDPHYYGKLAEVKRAEIWIDFFDSPNAKGVLYPLLGHKRTYTQKGDPVDTYETPHPDGFALFALAFGLEYKTSEMEDYMERTLKINPNHRIALLSLAQLRISDERYEDAHKKIERVLKINPKSLEALSLLASLHYLEGHSEKFEEIRQQVLLLNPHYGHFYYLLSNCIESKRQFEKSVELLQKAIELDPLLIHAYRALGVSLMRVGQEKEALEAFHKFRQFNNSDEMSFNMLSLFQQMESFETIVTPHFIVRLDVTEKPVMEPYLLPWLEEAYEALQKKYEFQVDSPILVEMFTKHDDFAVRTVGFGGLGALGACFGKLITLDSPKARKVGEFNWAATAWHEFAHVITLQMSSYRVPRWFTEGLSEYEEHCRNPSWSRDMELHFYAYWSRGQMRGMETFNEGFRVPAEIVLCYYQGGLLCRYIAENYGFPQILEMLHSYGKGQTTEEVFASVLKTDYKKFDHGFENWLKATVFKHMKMLPYYSSERLEDFKDEWDEDPENLEVLKKLALGYFQQGNMVDAEICAGLALQREPNNKEMLTVLGRILYGKQRFKNALSSLEKAVQLGLEDFHVYLALAQISLQERQVLKAIDFYQKAKACFPSYIGAGNSYIELVKIYESLNQTENAIKELEAYCAIEGNDPQARLKLAKYYQQKNQHDKAITVLNAVHEIYTYEIESHLLLAKSFQATQNHVGLIQEIQIALHLQPEKDVHVLHTDLAEAYISLKKIEEARLHLQTALKLLPDYTRAQKLLESLDQ
jgi:tetratricopeptide (TPR) repeat protein